MVKKYKDDDANTLNAHLTCLGGSGEVGVRSPPPLCAQLTSSISSS